MSYQPIFDFSYCRNFCISVVVTSWLPMAPPTAWRVNWPDPMWRLIYRIHACPSVFWSSWILPLVRPIWMVAWPSPMTILNSLWLFWWPSAKTLAGKDRAIRRNLSYLLEIFQSSRTLRTQCRASLWSKRQLIWPVPRPAPSIFLRLFPYGQWHTCRCANYQVGVPWGKAVFTAKSESSEYWLWMGRACQCIKGNAAEYFGDQHHLFGKLACLCHAKGKTGSTATASGLSSMRLPASARQFRPDCFSGHV